MQNQNQAQMSDKTMLTDMLGTEKRLVGLYATFLCECASEDLRQLFQSTLNSTSQDQHQTFCQMQQRGWYNIENAEAQKVNQARQELTQLKSQL
ncbi:MAG: spore coat protein [Christensenellaceae bacterium]|jgi:spore coat protein CotF|nr:spore coat protein [Christensenellaceae bacterium]